MYLRSTYPRPQVFFLTCPQPPQPQLSIPIPRHTSLTLAAVHPDLNCRHKANHGVIHLPSSSASLRMLDARRHGKRRCNHRFWEVCWSPRLYSWLLLSCSLMIHQFLPLNPLRVFQCVQFPLNLCNVHLIAYCNLSIIRSRNCIAYLSIGRS